MSYSTINSITLFFAILAMVAALLVIAIVASALTGDRLRVVRSLRPVALELAAAVAVTCTIGSLIMSEVLNFEPCLNCWVQRGFMYPAALLLMIATFTRRMALAKAAGILALLGLPVAIFHRYEQATGTEIGGLCGSGAPCSAKYFEQFGFVTIPTMAGIGFAAIIALTVIAVGQTRRSDMVDDQIAQPSSDGALV